MILKCLSKRGLPILVLLLSIILTGNTYANTYKNKIGTFPYLFGSPPIIYERYSNQENSVSFGILFGFFDFTEEMLTRGFSEPIDYNVRSYAINPFIALYSGNNDDWIRPAVRLTFSLIYLDPGNDFKELYGFPAYELHVFTDIKKGQFYATPGFGYKQFLTKQTITYKNKTADFPEFKLTPDSKPQSWLPILELPIGLLF